ncbi:proline racemase family protein [Faecalicatena sp. AGMB00832]|uniref:Proline racemase family protein n=1 Tax=Faecalicatena faecalis TaxID=2726362 RepID=A0ABS6D288_9FIRM|nr:MULTISPECIES: proline racemase family protein [Faecalicatena]MBU3875707.1 proline racemase family protein [Faecalicatena faecalis]MCI6466891.1 proline racemase family protein [Faecalicatena sp.]MDY5617599.1 proline racemase family protein [Lachnospiraceae bacterium]
MKIKKTFHTIDTHTSGEPTRNVLGGIPYIKGNTMLEKLQYMMTEGDWVRQLLTYEPRGNDVMSGTIITAPCSPEADIGVLYFEVGGWMPMCGHDTIGVGTALVESGMIEVTEPFTYVTLDTAAGLVKLKIEVVEGEARSVSFLNAPAFVMAENVTVNTDEYGPVTLDIAYGGNIYAILPAASVGLTLNPKNSAKIIQTGNLLKDEINTQIQVMHPEIPFANHVTHVEFYENSQTQKNLIRNAVVIPPGAIDRSPCGTGTSAKLSVLAKKGLIQKGESFIHESIIGGRFECTYVDDALVGSLPAVIPEVKGRAFITGIHTFMLDPEDIFPAGYQLA